MIKQSTFSIGHLRIHTEELLAAVHGSNEVVVIAENGAPKAVLQDIQAFHSLNRAVSLLEKLAIEHAVALEDKRVEINNILGQLAGPLRLARV